VLGLLYFVMKDSYYFSHDYNARNDEKIKKLIRIHGWTGYGLFWAIIEELYNNANALQSDYEGIAFELRTDKDCIHSILNDFDLFVHDGDKFGSLSVQRRLDEKDIKSKKASINARKRWDNYERNAIAMPSHEVGNALKEIKDIKESKESVVTTPPHPLVKWLAENCKEVTKMKKPLTNDEATNLVAEFTKEEIKETFMNMENYKPLQTKSISAYLTCKKWITKDRKEKGGKMPVGNVMWPITQ
jgi:hypothetical protein